MNTLTLSKLISEGIPFAGNIGLYIFTAFIQFCNIVQFIAPIVIIWMVVRMIKK